MKTTVDAKRILAYGDSITWGRVPNQFTRFDETTRWTGALQVALGDDYDVIEEGLRGRTLSGENPYMHYRDGLNQFGPILASQFPVDLLILFLGTNDTNSKINKTPVDIANGLHDYFKTTAEWADEFQVSVPKILIISPPHVNENTLKPDSMFSGAAAKSANLAPLYEAIAKQYGAHFFDSSKVVAAGDEDGVHMGADAHKTLGAALAPVVRSIFDIIPE